MKRTLIKTDNLTLSPGPPSISVMHAENWKWAWGQG